MSRRPLIWALIALLWVFAVVAAYYVAHKPFTVKTGLAALRVLKSLLGAILMTGLAVGLGRRILGSLSHADEVEILILSTAVGLGALSVLTLALGLLGWLRPGLFWALTLFGLITLSGSISKSIREALEDPVWDFSSRFERVLALYCALMLFIALVWALTPPTAWDSLVYHLTGPKMYLSSGRVSHPLNLPYLGFPQLMEMLFTWGMGLTGERTAALLHWAYALLSVLALASIGRRWFNRTTGWLAAAMLLSARSIVQLAGWPYVDLALLLYATLAFLAVARSLYGGKWLILGGVMAGLALSTKYTALALLPALAVVLLILRPSAGQPRGRFWFLGIGLWMLAVWFLLLSSAIIAWSPWLLKNFLLTGNPTYPFFFDGIYWNDGRAWWYDRPGTGLAYTAPWRLLTAPWDATIWGIEGAAGYSATIGPLFLALLPLLLLVWRRLRDGRRRRLRAALGFCGVLYLFWLWGVARTALLRQTRLLFPAFGVLALIAAAAVDGLRKLPVRPVNIGWLVRIIVVGVLALTLVGNLLSSIKQQPLQVLLGFESREEFLSRRLGWYYATIKHINAKLPADAAVLFLWEPRSYHCSVRIDCRPDALLDRWEHTIHRYGHDADAIADAWRAQGITHVLLHQAGLEHIVDAGFDPITSRDLHTLDELQSEHLTLVESFGSAYELYRWRSLP